jgi:ribosome-associated protein
LNNITISSKSKLSATGVEATFAGEVTRQRTPSKKTKPDDNALLLESIVSGMKEVKANDIVVLDLRNLSNAMADFFVVCHGNSNTQVQAISQSVEKDTIKATGDAPWHVEGMRNAKWVLMDYVNIVVHIFDKESRNFYGLEDLWADAHVQAVPEG